MIQLSMKRLFYSISFLILFTTEISGQTPAVVAIPSKTIQTTETKIAVFIGYTEKANYKGRTALFNAVKINSFAEYQRVFGNAITGSFLYESVRLFYLNGGGECYIISAGTKANPVRLAELLKGLEISKKVPAQILVAPDAVNLSEKDFYTFQSEMLSLCGTTKDRFAILNTLRPGGNVRQDLEIFRQETQSPHLSRGAVYYPWLVNSAGELIPPSGAVAGAYVKTDNSRGVWKAPANVSLSGVSGLSYTLSTSDREFANVSPADGKSVNTIATFSGKGILIWGARTLAGNDNEWRYVPVRRLGIMLDQSLNPGLNWAVFEPNDANLWAVVRNEVNAFLNGLYRLGAFQGTKPSDAYFVRCGLGSTMTASDIQQGKLIVEIGFAPLRPAEFIILRFEKKMQ